MKIMPLTEEQRQLVMEHRDFAECLGRRFALTGRQRGVAVEDLMQESCYGLCIAAMKYDARRGVGFKTYAYYWCRRYILRALYGWPQTLSLDDDGGVVEHKHNIKL